MPKEFQQNSQRIPTINPPQCNAIQHFQRILKECQKNSKRIPIEFPENSKRFLKEFPKDFQKIPKKFLRIPKTFPSNFRKIAKKLNLFKKFKKNSQKFPQKFTRAYRSKSFSSLFFVMSAQSHFCNLSSDTTDFKQLCITTGCLTDMVFNIKINLFILFCILATMKPIISIIIYNF